jgi:hypothetical protein
MDPITSKISKPFGPGSYDTSQPLRTPGWQEFSKFDQVRQQTRTTAVEGPGVTLQQLDVVGRNWRADGAKLHDLRRRVSALPETGAFESIRSRLADLDSLYQSVGSRIDAISGSASAEQFLKLQKDMYQVTENIGLISKVIDQVTSGVRSLLQTQI